MRNQNPNQSQLAAMRRAFLLGRTLQSDYPEIGRLYESNTVFKIIQLLNIPQKYSVTMDVAKTAVYSALKGSEGQLSGAESYAGILDELSFERIKIRHWAEEATKKNNKKTMEQLINEGHKGYNSGLAKKTPEERSRYAQQSVISRGMVPWTQEEEEVTYQLFLKSNSKRLNKNISHQIADTLNQTYHNGASIRTLRSISQKLYMHKKFLMVS